MTLDHFYSLHQMPPYRKFKKSFDLSNSLKISTQGLSLPSSLNIKEEDIKYISNALKELLIQINQKISYFFNYLRYVL